MSYLFHYIFQFLFYLMWLISFNVIDNSSYSFLCYYWTGLFINFAAFYPHNNTPRQALPLLIMQASQWFCELRVLASGRSVKWIEVYLAQVLCSLQKQKWEKESMKKSIILWQSKKKSLWLWETNQGLQKMGICEIFLTRKWQKTHSKLFKWEKVIDVKYYIFLGNSEWSD
jgi:hypothetical protein